MFRVLTEVTVEDFDRVNSTNVRSAYYHPRCIINLCSTRYRQYEAGTEGYSASKGGIYSLTHVLAASFAPMHITVNAIAPSWIHVRESEML